MNLQPTYKKMAQLYQKDLNYKHKQNKGIRTIHYKYSKGSFGYKEWE